MWLTGQLAEKGSWCGGNYSILILSCFLFCDFLMKSSLTWIMMEELLLDCKITYMTLCPVLYVQVCVCVWLCLCACTCMTNLYPSSNDVKQLAQEVCESIKDTIGPHNFVQIYSQIRKHLKAKRDKRRQEEKFMAVVNPVRNAKRKLRIAAKHRVNKKRKIMTMKMGRWIK